MASSTLWKLRRLAPRALRVLDRHKAKSPAIAAFTDKMVPTAEAFIAAYDETGRYEPTWRKEMDEGRGAVKEVLITMRSWLPLVQRDILGFNSASFGDCPTVPDDIIEDGSRLFDLVNDYHNVQGQPLPYQKACCETLEVVLKNATKEVTEAEVADKKYQELMAQVRQTAAVFDMNLQAFRKTLAVITGRNDKDYQKLRAQKAEIADAEDDPNAPAAPMPVPPATAGNNQPVLPS